MAQLKVSLLLLCVVSAMIISGESRKTWVLLLSGAKEYYNYSLQSMVYHAYQVLRSKGIPAKTIVHMNYDDVATAPENPVKQNLVTLPNGTNWYSGGVVDYSGREVTVDVFLTVLCGDKDGVRKLLGREGRVIDSGPDDHIFLYMADHGDKGVFGFPNEVLSVHALQRTLRKMYEKKKYAKMMIYMEACYSGSMFYRVLPNDTNIMAITAANDHEVAYACCFDNFRKVYVGGVFDNAWTYDTAKHDVDKEKFSDQYEVMKEACNQSHPSIYGDHIFADFYLREFQGPAPSQLTYSPLSARTEECPLEKEVPKVPASLKHLPYFETKTSVQYQDIDLINPPMNMLEIATVARQLLHATDPKERQTLETQLLNLDALRSQADEFFHSLLVGAFGKGKAQWLQAQKHPDVEAAECYYSALDLLKDKCHGLDYHTHTFMRKNFRSLIQLCNMMDATDVMILIKRAVRLSKIC